MIQKALADDPRSPGYWLVLGETQLKLGKAAEAETSLHKAIDLGVQSPTAYFALGNACARQGKNEKKRPSSASSLRNSKPRSRWIPSNGTRFSPRPSASGCRDDPLRSRDRPFLAKGFPGGRTEPAAPCLGARPHPCLQLPGAGRLVSARRCLPRSGSCGSGWSKSSRTTSITISAPGKGLRSTWIRSLGRSETQAGHGDLAKRRPTPTPCWPSSTCRLARSSRRRAGTLRKRFAGSRPRRATDSWRPPAGCWGTRLPPRPPGQGSRTGAPAARSFRRPARNDPRTEKRLPWHQIEQPRAAQRSVPPSAGPCSPCSSRSSRRASGLPSRRSARSA